MIKKLGLKKLNEMTTIADKITIGVIVTISIILIVVTPRIIADENSSAQKIVVVKLQNEKIYSIPLKKSSQIKRDKFKFTVDGEQYQGVLYMKNGKVKLERLNKEISPLPIHAEMGWVSESYQMIVCMPIKLTVTIEEKGQVNRNKEVDVHTF
jgi:hypothetical protein